MLIYTIGHSTRTLDDFLKLLEEFQIELLFDVRTVPKSRHVPHFNADALMAALQGQGIEYRHCKGLGGLRKPAKDSLNQGWRNASFRGFADYMQTEGFRRGVADLLDAASKKRTALMCAEAVPWRCHRSLIADALVSFHGAKILHIFSGTKLQNHEMTPFAAIEGGRLTYPKSNPAEKLI